jgi:hypothetical protein
MGEIVSLQFAQAKNGRQDAVDSATRERLLAQRERRAAWGQSLRQRRVLSGFTTRRLAEAIGVMTPTLISAVEAGRGRVPQGSLAGWAVALGMEPSAFATDYLAAFEPDIYAAVRHLLEERGPA